MREITDIKEVQSISLNILKYIDKVCKENNIQYFLAGGTALGAVRHGGFIPWDDDIDITMTRPNYNKFLEIMDKTESKQFKCLHHGKNFPNYCYRFAKVVDLSTTLTEGEFINNPDLGVFVDVFPADGIDKSKANKIIKKVNFYASMIWVSSAKKYIKSTKGSLRNLIKYCAYTYAKLLGWKYWLKKHETLTQKFDYEKSNNVLVYCGVYGLKELFDKRMYEELTEIKFEDSKFPMLINYDTYLTALYGDYMTPPPIEKQIPHHDIKIYKKD